MDNSLIKRLEEVREDLGMNQKKFSEVIGVTPQNYNGWLNGEFKPKVEVFLKLNEKWPVYNLEYILTGVGELKKKGVGTKENINSESINLSEKRESYGNRMLAEKLILIFEFGLKVLKENN
jgi:transcriptional regulator with XRE-family HTH domain